MGARERSPAQRGRTVSTLRVSLHGGGRVYWTIYAFVARYNVTKELQEAPLMTLLKLVALPFHRVSVPPTCVTYPDPVCSLKYISSLAPAKGM